MGTLLPASVLSSTPLIHSDLAMADTLCIGTYKRTDIGNIGEFLTKMGSPEEFKKAYCAMEVSYEMSKNGDTWTWKNISDAGTHITEFKEGEPFDMVAPDGRPVNVTFTRDGNTFNYKQQRRESRPVQVSPHLMRQALP